MGCEDPYKVLGVKPGCTLEELKRAYRQKAMIVHPTRGGSDELFNIVTESFRTLFTALNNVTAESCNVAAADVEDIVKHAFSKGDGTIDMDKFNEVFEQHRTRAPENAGYGDRMIESTSAREDFTFTAPQHLIKDFNATKFNEMFEQQAACGDARLYDEPEPLGMFDNMAFGQLGLESVADFSAPNTGGGLNYSDYMKAHTTGRLIDPRIVEKRPEFRSVEELEKHRAKQDYTPRSHAPSRDRARIRRLFGTRSSETRWRPHRSLQMRPIPSRAFTRSLNPHSSHPCIVMSTTPSNYIRILKISCSNQVFL